MWTFIKTAHFLAAGRARRILAGAIAVFALMTNTPSHAVVPPVAMSCRHASMAGQSVNWDILSLASVGTPIASAPPALARRSSIARCTCLRLSRFYTWA